MRAKRIVVGMIATSALVAAGYVLYLAGLKRGTQTAIISAQAPSVAGAAATAADDRKVLYWHDPMVPGPKFDRPGKSPFMDMQLVPMYADAAGADSGVTISSRAQQNLGMRTAQVAMGSLAAGIDAVGSVAWNERDVSVVPARANGFVEKLYVRAALDPVAKGQALAELYVPDWVAAQEEFLSLRNSTTRSGAQGLGDLLDGARQRMRLAGMNEQQIAAVEARGVVTARMTVTAPIGGVLTEIGVREGSSVDTGTQIARINGLGTVWINADVPEALAAQVRIGSAVEARTSAGVDLKGKVAAILPDINATTRTIKVRAEVPNPNRQLVPGMFVTLRLKPASGADVLLIPSEAVIATGTRTVVMVVQDNGQFMPTQVETGAEANGQTEIKRGLKAGQKVVLSGQFLLDSEASLKNIVPRAIESAGIAASSATVPAQAADYRGEGVVESISSNQVTLSHGPIAALKWPPMTMGFGTPAAGLPRGIKVGDRVSFTFHPTADGQYQLTTIVPIVPKPAAAGAPR